MKAIDKYWLANQDVNQRIVAHTLPSLGAPILSLTRFRLAVAGWLGSFPSWVLLVMIILAALGTASAVTVRMRSELQFSSQQYQRTASEVERLRHGNASLGIEIRRMTNDPRLIESVARSRLGMVRPNDIVVPTESLASSNMVQSFTR